MVLRYRGVCYSYKSPKLDLPAEIRTGCYRGVVWRSPIVQSIECSQPFRILRYRGVLYATGTLYVKENPSEIK
jgi:hypothetical protein